MLAAGQPMAGYVFVLDGVLIGAGDARYLAIAGVVNLAAYLPLLLAVLYSGAGAGAGLLWLWAAFSLGLHGGAGADAGPPGPDGPVDGARRAVSAGRHPPADVRSGGFALNWTGDSSRSA